VFCVAGRDVVEPVEVGQRLQVTFCVRSAFRYRDEVVRYGDRRAERPQPASAIADASISLTGIWREVLKFVRLALPLLRVSRGSLFDRNIRPSFRIVCVKLQPLLRARFGIRLDRLDRAFRLAHAAIDAFVRMDDEHVLTLVETIDGADLYAVHQFALDATLVDDVGQLIDLPADRGVQIIHDVRHRGARSLAESERREDLRPLAGSERRAMRILLLRGLRLLRCTKPLHRGTYSPGKHRSTDAAAIS